MTRDDIQIRFGDIDAFNHVNNINIQHYFDLGKMNYYRNVLGIDVIDANPALVIVSTTTNYFSPILIADKIEVETSIVKLGNKSVTFYQRVVDKSSQATKAECTTIMTGFDRVALCSIELLDEWVDAICRQEEKTVDQLKNPKL